ncbi:hypothetical protein BJY01DRAFT_260395 [Aspergillus pseudoustus]|uniref:HD domain-containing protein n=1 Tax=Aspergillus pseudoustus TaxID=1810923 RepID=A0ABR4IX37_9EURO
MPLPPPHETITHLFTFIAAQGHKSYLGERISQLAHSLQCAHLARTSPTYSHDPEVILAALLHDVGRFIPDADAMPALIAPDGAYIGRASHEVLGERYLRQLGFSERVCQLVGAHVAAKRFLTATEPAYYEGLSETSKRTLGYQGGIFTAEQVREARQDPWLESKLAVRRWDDQAKDPHREVPGLDAYTEMAVKSLIKSRAHVSVLHRDYPLPTKPVLVISLPDTLSLGSVQDALLAKRRDDRDWIVEPSHHPKSSDSQVLEQLAIRGIPVVRISADSDDHTGHAGGLGRDIALAKDPNTRSGAALEGALSSLRDSGDVVFVYVSLAAGLEEHDVSEVLDHVADELRSIQAVVAVTTEGSPAEEGTDLTVLDAVLERAAK